MQGEWRSRNAMLWLEQGHTTPRMAVGRVFRSKSAEFMRDTFTLEIAPNVDTALVLLVCAIVDDDLKRMRLAENKKEYFVNLLQLSHINLDTVLCSAPTNSLTALLGTPVAPCDGRDAQAAVEFQRTPPPDTPNGLSKRPCLPSHSLPVRPSSIASSSEIERWCFDNQSTVQYSTAGNSLCLASPKPLLPALLPFAICSLVGIVAVSESNTSKVGTLVP